MNESPIALIQRTVSYLDSVSLLLRHEPAEAELQEIRQHCGSTYADDDHRTRNGELETFFHQPQPDALRLLDDLAAARRGRLRRVHVALDQLTRTEKDAHALRAWLAPRLRSPRSRNEVGKEIGATSYATLRPFGDAQRGAAELVCYSDQPSKVTGSPCCHVELRINGTQRVSSWGKTRGVDHERPSSLIDLSPLEAVGRHGQHGPEPLLRVETVDWLQLAKQSIEEPRSKADENDERIRGAMIRLRQRAWEHTGGRDEPSAQAVRQAFKDEPWFRPASALRTDVYDVAALLPDPGRGWDWPGGV